MPRTIRTLVACFLLMAVPFQGFAAASMSFCGLHQPDSAQSAESGRGCLVPGHWEAGMKGKIVVTAK